MGVDPLNTSFIQIIQLLRFPTLQFLRTTTVDESETTPEVRRSVSSPSPSSAHTLPWFVLSVGTKDCWTRVPLIR